MKTLYHVMKRLYIKSREIAIFKRIYFRNIYIVLEYMDAKSLTDFIYFKYQDIPEHLIAYIVKKIVQYVIILGSALNKKIED